MSKDPAASQHASPPPHDPVRPHKPVIGLLGGIASGKSLVARQLASMGCAVIDADELARNALDEPEVQRQLVQWWGPGVQGDDGGISRRAVAGVVFNDPAELRRLEALVHPRVNAARQRLRRQYQADPAVRAIVEDCPLLIEKGLDSTCDALIVVQATRQTRLRRIASSRGWSAEELARREKNQIPLDTKAERADYSIDNDADEAQCLEQVRRVLSRILHDTD